MDIEKLVALLIKNDFKLSAAVDQYGDEDFYYWYITSGHRELREYLDDNQEMVANFFQLRMLRAMCGDKSLDKELYKTINNQTVDKVDPILQSLKDITCINS